MTVIELPENMKRLPLEQQRDIGVALFHTRVERRSSGQPAVIPRFSQGLLDRVAARREHLGREARAEKWKQAQVDGSATKRGASQTVEFFFYETLLRAFPN